MGKIKIKKVEAVQLPPITNQNRNDWNLFVDWLEKKGVKGKAELDSNELGNKYLAQYIKETPTTSLTVDLIKPIQNDFQDYRTFAINEVKNKRGNFGVGVDESNFMKNLSNIDGLIGQYTSQVKFPLEYMKFRNKGTQDVIRTDTIGYSTKPQ